MEPFDDHEKRLRESYFRASPHQRLKVAIDRMRYPTCGPNTLIQVVSAVEGLSRSLVINRLCATGKNIEETYEGVRNKNSVYLVRQCIKLYLGMKPEEKFGEENWAIFKHAVNYRNLLIHECTFLQRGYSNKLISAATDVFDCLEGLTTGEATQ